MAKSPEEAMAAMIAGLKEKTGKTLDEWLKVAAAAPGRKHGEVVAHLKKDGLTHGYANLVAHKLLGSDAVSVSEGGTDLVAEQYGGAKAPLRPIYDVLSAAAQAFGSDVELSPKKAYVSLRRSKQFGLIQPSTATRVDLGLNLKGVAPSGRLEASGSFNAMCTHRVKLASPGDVDAEVLGWLRQAYAGA